MTRWRIWRLLGSKGRGSEKCCDRTSGGLTRQAVRAPSPRPRSARRAVALLHEPVELAGVLADDLPADVRRQMPELALDVLRGIRPDAIGMREIRRPHDIVDPELVEELHADLVGLEGGLALPPPVLARRHAQAEILELVLPLEVHAVEDVGDPADPALAEHQGDPRMA